jgi:hypothetical protein
MKGMITMARTKLVCNLGLADFFTLPDSPEVWRKCGREPSYWETNGKRTKGYDCVSLYDNSIKVWLPGNQRVELVDE